MTFHEKLMVQPALNNTRLLNIWAFKRCVLNYWLTESLFPLQHDEPTPRPCPCPGGHRPVVE